MDNTFIQEKLLPRLTFNPGLELTGFHTTRPKIECYCIAGLPPALNSSTWVKRGTVRVKCLAQEHNTMCPARG